mmetsp:Transcript_28825/g.83443  ORF Transcript_28825/g.83443 Transcript_28825/m.83443 type:complete len:832 (-) Transcript_28825:166-2661(-)
MGSGASKKTADGQEVVALVEAPAASAGGSAGGAPAQASGCSAGAKADLGEPPAAVPEKPKAPPEGKRPRPARKTKDKGGAVEAVASEDTAPSGSPARRSPQDRGPRLPSPPPAASKAAELDDDDDDDETTTTIITTTSITRTETTTTKTFTTSTSTTSTSTTGPYVFGGNITEDAFAGWLSIWRNNYQVGLWNAGVPDPWESLMPKSLKGIKPIVVESSGGVAGGIVTEGMGYGIMIEGFLAAKGKDVRALNYSLALIKSWQGMVNGGAANGKITQPFAGGENKTHSATKVDQWPYGISAVEWSHEKLAPAGVPAWKFPLTEKNIQSNMGSAADGDQDAILGMIYTAHALDFPSDFVDMVMRSVISFASADLGFPDLYRILPNGEKIYVPKLGSMWGGLLPEHGKFKTLQQPWCYSPGYFAPAHYRTMRDFALKHWKKEYNDYMPNTLAGKPTTLDEMAEAFDSAVTAGYNILYYSSCSSGSVSNWVGVQTPCANDNDLNCVGVPWRHTPWVGPNGGECAQSGTRFGSFGADASRSAWRIAMDYVLYREESSEVVMYDRDGYPAQDIRFGAQRFLNRIVFQYSRSSICDGGVPGDCFFNTSSPYRMAYAYDVEKFNATHVTCDNVPNPPESWWAGFMAYPTFAAFVAPFDEIGAEQMTNWMDTFSSICNFTMVDKWNFTRGHKPRGSICLTSYFEASQAVIATMVMSNNLVPIFSPSFHYNSKNQVTILENEAIQADAQVQAAARNVAAVGFFGAGVSLVEVSVVLLLAMCFVAMTRRRRTWSGYSVLSNGRAKSPRDRVASGRRLVPAPAGAADADETMRLSALAVSEDA